MEIMATLLFVNLKQETPVWVLFDDKRLAYELIGSLLINNTIMYIVYRSATPPFYCTV